VNKITAGTALLQPAGRRKIAPSEPHESRRQTPPPQPATLWNAWLSRFAKVEQFSADLTQVAERIRTRARIADPVEGRRLQDQYLNLWMELLETFDAAAGSEVVDALRRDYLAYLNLRVGLIRALIRRCLAPSDTTVTQVESAMQAQQDFIAARRRRT